MGWFHNSLVAFDDWWNSNTGGIPDVTISSRAALARNAGLPWGINMCKALDAMSPTHDHCDQAIVNDLKRAKDAEEFLAMHENLAAAAGVAQATADSKGIVTDTPPAATVAAAADTVLSGKGLS